MSIMINSLIHQVVQHISDMCGLSVLADRTL